MVEIIFSLAVEQEYYKKLMYLQIIETVWCLASALKESYVVQIASMDCAPSCGVNTIALFSEESRFSLEYCKSSPSYTKSIIKYI